MDQTRLDFAIEGLSCAGCVGRAEKALLAVPGVDMAEVNLATRRARVGLGEARAGEVAAALEEAGYPARAEDIRLRIEGMTCASCVARVEDALANVPGVTGAHVNLADGTARVTSLTGDAAPLIAAVAGTGYTARELEEVGERTDPAGDEAAHMRRNFIIAAVLTLPLFLIEMGGHVFPALHHLIGRTIGMQTSWMLQFGLATLVLAWPGRVFFAKGAPALLRRAPDMNALVAMGAGAAWAYSTVATFLPGLLPEGTVAVYFEAAAVIVTLILLGRWLEARAKGRTGEAIKRLVGMRPDTARVERDGAVVEIPVDDVQPGDRLHLRPGDRIAVDGVLVEGSGFIDEAMLTGEPLPVEKHPGDGLAAGTINGNAALVMEAKAVGRETLLARIIAMVEEAQGARLPVQDLVNRITAWFVPAVMAVAAVTVVIWLIFGPAPALPFALVAGVSVLIIACPCAMGLATPMSIMVGTGRAADLGVLFRRGDALQQLQGVDVVAFDKTGTLTMGKPQVSRISTDWDEDDLLALVAAAEAASEHPLANAIVAAAEKRGLSLPDAQGVEAHPGRGLSAEVGGRSVLIGNAAMLQGAGVEAETLVAEAEAMGADGLTTILIAVDGVAAGVIGVSDQIKPSASAAVQGLQEQGVEVALISGDTEAAAQAVAREVGISRVIAGVLPEGKVDAVRDLQEQGLRVGFVGDGINDAPALAAADVGLAMGSGTDVAMDSADVVIVSGNPAGVLAAVEISRRTMRNIRQNLVWAFGYNILLIPVAAGVLYAFGGPLLSPQLAAGAMALSSVLVVTNALRLRRVKAEGAA